MRSQPRNNARGFSLPELMVVLSIIMLLAVLAIPRMRGGLRKAEEAVAGQSMRNMQSSQEAYRITHGSYAASFAVLTDEGGGPLLSGEGDLGSGGDTLYHKGYIFELNLIAPDQYTLSAEPVINRDTRPWYEMDQTGAFSITGGGEEIKDEVGSPGEG